MSNVAIIPARSGSKSIKDKNLLTLSGHTLLEWSIVACLKSKMIDNVIVSTDSEVYKSIALKAGALVPFIRPSEFARDNSTDFDVFNHALKWLDNNNCKVTNLVHIRPTTPLRDPAKLDQAIELFLSNTCNSSLRSVHKMSESSYKTFEICDGSLALLNSSIFTGPSIDQANSARQDFPDTYMANGYIDIVRPDLIRESRCMHGTKALPFITEPSLEVDSLDDYLLMKAYINLVPEISNILFSQLN